MVNRRKALKKSKGFRKNNKISLNIDITLPPRDQTHYIELDPIKIMHISSSMKDMYWDYIKLAIIFHDPPSEDFKLEEFYSQKEIENYKIFDEYYSEKQDILTDVNYYLQN